MSEVWGLLAKSLTDAQTINEAIDAAIAAHEADASAHLGAGESLEAHKTSEVIDHLAESIVEDKLGMNFFNKGIFNWNWPSIDSFYYGGGIPDAYLGSFEFYTTTTLNSRVWVEDKVGYINGCDFNSDPVLEFMAQFRAQGTYEAYFGLGDREGYFDEYFAGFKILNGTLYARTYTVGTSTETLVEIEDVDPTAIHKYRIEYYHGVNVVFYIDGVQVATITTNMPDGGATCRIYSSIKTTEAGHQAYFILGTINFVQS